MTTIDIMLPYYGDVALMQDAVRSVLAQANPGWRLTVVDDTAEPSVPGWFDSLGDDRVRYFRNEQNLGVTGNFTRCLELAEHDLLVMLGADDLMLPNYVDIVLAARDEHPGAAMIQPGVEVIDEHGRPVKGLADEVKRRLYAPKVTGRRQMGGEELATSLLRGNWLYFPAMTWRTAAIKSVGFRPELRTTQDLALELELIERGEQMVLDSTVCFQYRRHLESVSSKMALDGDRFTEERALFLEMAERMRAKGWQRASRAARGHSASRLHALTLLPTAMRGGQRDIARALAKHAFGNS
ncbi:MAG: putative glycosyltransferase [Amycolatopsis sp.]|jgi:GT2 family glycosyltransferase|uniref:glycosyltransferase family 2 protein n=1 Tax=Amycolatopsis sp. TaxID=37632 RepID=UPI002625DE11|nr:glycosyltransferase [Amycolatopsis sp.]MCU1680500.1 putative glycosyltransferase [Amycolatopsis sp.]